MLFSVPSAIEPNATQKVEFKSQNEGFLLTLSKYSAVVILSTDVALSNNKCARWLSARLASEWVHHDRLLYSILL